MHTDSHKQMSMYKTEPISTKHTSNRANIKISNKSTRPHEFQTHNNGFEQKNNGLKIRDPVLSDRKKESKWKLKK